MVRPLPLPPDGVISNRRMAQIRRRHREKILKMAQRQKARQEASEQRKIDKPEKTTKKPESIELKPPLEPEIQEENPNSPRRILRDIQMQRMAKRKKSVPIENKEFYPEKLKRKVVYKKIKLTPNQELVPLGCINKRKRSDPKKGEEYEQAVSKEMPIKNEPKPAKRRVRNIIREETVEEIIMRIEETDSLTDEDLMEILTCPSPVWWEEPMNTFYFDEEPINKKLQKTHRKRQNQASIKQNQTDNRIEKLEISLANRDERFVAKRSTLENILSNIKGNIEPIKNSPNSSRKMFQKRQWKNLDEANPAFGLKRNSKGQFLKKKFGSSPITISDVSEKDETQSNNYDNPKITPKPNDLDKSPNIADIPKIIENTNIDLTNNEKDKSETNETLKSNLVPNKDGANNPIDVKNNNINEYSIDIIKTDINKDLNENKESEESPKALIWTSNTGEQKVITFTQDIEMSSDGVEIVTDTADLDIPEELPPLKWYPRTVTKEMVETSDTTSDEFNNQQSDDKNTSSDNDSAKEISNSQEQKLNKDEEGIKDVNKDLDMELSKCGDVNEIPNNDNKSFNESDDSNHNDTNDIEAESIFDTTKSDEISDNDVNTKETRNKNPLFGALEKAIDYFRNKNKDVGTDREEKDKNRDDYVVVYKIDETFKDTNEGADEELKEIDGFNELFDGTDAVSGTIEGLYKNIKNGHRTVLSKND